MEGKSAIVSADLMGCAMNNFCACGGGMTNQKERPISFSASMLCAVRESRKTMTRRLIKPQPYIDNCNNFCWNGGNFGQSADGIPHRNTLLTFKHKNGRRGYCPYGQVGDHLWVREAWRTEARFDHFPPREVPASALISYEADYDREPNDGCRGRYRHARFMPRKFSRTALEITDIRVERLNDISADDAQAEGIPTTVVEHTFVKCFRDKGERDAERLKRFRQLWEKLHGPCSWDENPWIWKISFRRIEQAKEAV